MLRPDEDLVSQGISAAQAADRFFAAIPHAMTLERLEEYGIDATPSQCEQLTLEVLLLNLFWIQSAARVALSPRDGARMMAAVHDCIHRHWLNTLRLREQDWSAFSEAVEVRRREYEGIVHEGGSPMGC
jgi:hypothetical protein